MADAHQTPAPQAPPLAIGAVVGDRYRIIKEIGGGGMGYVFEAEHIALERRFALKVLRVGHWDEELVRRFEREARALGKISSPRVAQVSDFGVADGIGPYYIMELVPGLSLQQRLDKESIAPREAVELAIGLCDALVDVHKQGIVHRDLKPANIGLPGGAIPIKLLDFGLAASVDDAFFTRITQSQQVLGSMPYISPEQFAGARPSEAQDIWAVGVVFYEMLTGALPFEAPSTAALMHRILTAPPSLIGDVPLPLGRALDRLLHKDPEQRVKSASDAAALLRSIDLDALPDKIDCGVRHIGTATTGRSSGVRPLTTGQALVHVAPVRRFKLALGIVAASIAVTAVGIGITLREPPSEAVAAPIAVPNEPAGDSASAEVPAEDLVAEQALPNEMPSDEEPGEARPDEAVDAEAAREESPEAPVVEEPTRREPRVFPRSHRSMRAQPTMEPEPPAMTSIQAPMEPATPAMNAAMTTWTGEIIE